MDRARALALLSGLPRFGAPGLARIEALLAQLPPAFPLPPAIKITGSNGKGSTAALAAAVLEALDIPTGLYTSPHFRRFEERVRIAGGPIGEGELRAAADWLETTLERFRQEHPQDPVTAFEATTALAAHAFQSRELDALVMEAGIGGRLDPTRVFAGAVTGLTSVDLEHTELLGATREEIARDKAALAPDGGVLVTGPLERELRDILEQELRQRRVQVEASSDRVRLRRVRVEPGATVFDLELYPDAAQPGWFQRDLRLSLRGRHQADNAAMAVALVYHWVSRYWLRLTSQEFSRAVREAFARVRWPGRFERVREADPPVWVDVAHTPAAVEAVAITAAEVFPAPPVLLLGASQGRDPARLLGRLLVRPRAVVVTRPPERGADSRAVAAALVALAPHVAIQAVEAPAEALAVACDLARDAERPLLVTGSYFLARVVAELLDAAAGDVGKQGGTTRSAGT